HRGGFLGLLALPPAPALHARCGNARSHGKSGHGIAPARPPRFEIVQLFLLFEVVDRHSFCPWCCLCQRGSAASFCASSSGATANCSPPPRSGLTATVPVDASSSPMMSA